MVDIREGTKGKAKMTEGWTREQCLRLKLDGGAVGRANFCCSFLFICLFFPKGPSRETAISDNKIKSSYSLWKILSSHENICWNRRTLECVKRLAFQSKQSDRQALRRWITECHGGALTFTRLHQANRIRLIVNGRNNN